MRGRVLGDAVVRAGTVQILRGGSGLVSVGGPRLRF